MSQAVILSFLGTGNYSPVRYHYQENAGESSKEYETQFFVEALHKFFPDYTVNVVMTSEADDKHGKSLRSLIECESVNIPSGKDETELWKMFDAIAQSIPYKAKLVVDITHGLRTQPMLALAACVYLRTVKQVKVEKILYGAFEAKDTQGRAPVFELTPFLELMDWSQAAQQLMYYSDAKPMRGLLNNIQTQTYLSDNSYKATSLSKVGNQLEKFTNALALIRPHEVVESANSVSDALASVHKDLEALEQTKPFALILEEIKQDIQTYTLPDEEIFSPVGFEIQAKILQRYLDSEQYTQALTLAREAIVSKLCIASGMRPRKQGERYETESLLNSAVERLKEAGKAKLSGEAVEAIQLWDSIRDLRNDINHAGMRKNPRSSKIAIDATSKNCKGAREFICLDSKSVERIFADMEKIVGG